VKLVTHSFDALILGGGAAGLMCAITAGQRGRRVAVLERADRAGKKILISGGGRCNFTNLHCRPDNFISANPHFAKSALSRYTPADFIEMVEKHRIPYHEKTLGQLFCDRSANDILAMLLEECRLAQVSLFPGSRISEVRRGQEFVVRAADVEFRAPVLVVATGGLSIPKIGATSFGYDLARQFGIKIREPRAGLVPFVLQEKERSAYCDLAGVSMEVTAACDGQQFREKMLITHRGLSGPAILQISSYWNSARRVKIDLAPEYDIVGELLAQKTARTAAGLRSRVRELLPNRFADRWVELHPPSAWTNFALEDWEKQMHGWAIAPAGTEGFDKAEVTVGGVDTDELSAKTMEARRVPGLFFIGEVVDVTGHLGVYNFQWAWASGVAAGEAL
jgi:predicted Rossmann fold flavoprotein